MRLFFVSIIVLSVCAFSMVTAGNQEELFLRAAQLYNKKEYAQALELYQTIQEAGPALWHNMGNCFYYLGQDAHALTSWYRAQRHAPLNLYEQCQKNIETLIYKDVPLHAQKKPIYKKLWAWIVTTSFLIIQLLILIWVYGLWFCYHRYGNGKRHKIFLLIFFLLSSIVCIGVYSIKYHQLTARYGVTLQENGVLYAGPAVFYELLDTVPYAQVVRVHATQNDWYKITYNNRTGWISPINLSVV